MPRKTPQATIDELTLALARGSTLAAAAKRLDLPERTARDIAGRDEVRARVVLLRVEITSRATGRLANLAVRAAATLGELLAPEHPANVRLAAAREILASLMKASTHVDAADRSARIDVEMLEGSECY